MANAQVTKTFAVYDPALNPSPVKGFLDFDFHDYTDDPATLAPMVEPNWSNRMSGQWIVHNGVVLPYVAPEPTQAELVATAKASLATIRYAHEIEGVTWTPANGNACLVATDRDSQSKLTAAFVLASAGRWIDGTRWKMADGTFVSLAAADVEAMALTVQAHVGACYDHESDLSSQIDATTEATSLAAIDLTAGWP